MINLRLCIKPLQRRFTSLFIWGDESRRAKELRSLSQKITLQAEFLALKEVKECLNKGRVSPSVFAINNIMSYAKALKVKPSKQLRIVDFVLN